jgi:ABC-type polysaccharide/polyol phosphate transport system ATPase subunit
VLGVGDAFFARKSQEAIEGHFSSHRTVVMISHDPQVIARLCNRAVLIQSGRSVLSGTPAEVSEAYLATTIDAQPCAGPHA